MRWLKLYPEARTDPKVQTLPAEQFRVWFNLLCLAAEQEKPGTIEYRSDAVLAVQVAGGDVALLHETLKRLETLETLETVSGVSSRFIAFRGWGKRQAIGGRPAAKTSTERVRKFRENQRLRHRGASGSPACDYETETQKEAFHPAFQRLDSDSDSEEARNSRAPREGHSPEESAAPVAAPSPAAPPGDCPPVPDDDGPLEPWPGQFKPTRAEIEATYRLAWKCFPETVIANEYFQRREFYSTRAWQDALREAARLKPGLERIGYVEGIARNNPDGIRRQAPAAGAPSPGRWAPPRPVPGEALPPTHEEWKRQHDAIDWAAEATAHRARLKAEMAGREERRRRNQEEAPARAAAFRANMERMGFDMDALVGAKRVKP